MRVGTDALSAVRPLRSEDREPLRRILETTGVFTGEEIVVAQELMDDALARGEGGDYEIAVAPDEDGAVVGFYCIGATPLTEGTYDLYWIAVDPAAQHRGVGAFLLRHAETAIRARGGRLLVAETSSLPHYANTRAFYQKHGYRELARISDYYRPGDDLIVYGKYLSQAKE